MKKNHVHVAWILVLGACTSIPKPLSTNLDVQNRNIKSCAELLLSVEQAIVKADVVDSESVRIEGYPYLRVNRFLSDFRESLTEATLETWLARLQRLAVDGWRFELMNLPAEEKSRLEARAKTLYLEKSTLIEVLQECGSRLQRVDLDTTRELQELQEKAIVPANYSVWRQIIGFYPVTAIPMRLGIARWHRTTLDSYRQPLNRLPLQGHVLRYAPETLWKQRNSEAIADIIKQSSRNSLAIPEPNADQQRLLFDHFSPVFEIDTASNDDRIGTPVLTSKNTVIVDVRKPAVFRKLTHTRVGSLNLLQLNYMVWFPSRPKQSALDILGGHLDGIIWRLTLLPNGKPWLFDSIHLCGCYHLFFPTASVQPKKSAFNWQEPDFMPQAKLAYHKGERMVVRIAAGSHYIERVRFSPAGKDHVIAYRLDDADILRSLPTANGMHHSMFSENGLVAGTERGERFLFWPMGIVNPGAMRQWGHHATAFVGRRHFDDPRLFERSFNQPIVE